MPDVFILGIMMLVILIFDFAFSMVILYFVAFRLLEALKMTTPDLAEKFSLGNTVKVSVYFAFLPFMIFFLYGLVIGFLYTFVASFFFGILLPYFFIPMHLIIIPGIPGIVDQLGLGILIITILIPIMQLVYTKQKLGLTWGPGLLIFMLVWFVPFLVNFAFLNIAGAIPMALR